MSTLIQECLNLAEKPNAIAAVDLAGKIASLTREMDQLAAEEEDLQPKIALLEARRDGLSGIEAHASAVISRQIADLKWKQHELREKGWELRGRWNVLSLQQRLKQEGFLRLSLEPFRWRDEEGWPRLALYSLNSPAMRFSSGGRWYPRTFWRREWVPYQQVRVRPNLPAPIQESFVDVVDKIAGLSSQKKANVSLFTEFTGVIPQRTKEKIKQAQALRIFNGNLFLLAEVGTWTLSIEEAAKPRRELGIPLGDLLDLFLLDPLLVGFAVSSLWVIDVFDPTPIEDYIANEFTT